MFIVGDKSRERQVPEYYHGYERVDTRDECLHWFY